MLVKIVNFNINSNFPKEEIYKHVVPNHLGTRAFPRVTQSFSKQLLGNRFTQGKAIPTSPTTISRHSPKNSNNHFLGWATHLT